MVKNIINIKNILSRVVTASIKKNNTLVHAFNVYNYNMAGILLFRSINFVMLMIAM